MPFRKIFYLLVLMAFLLASCFPSIPFSPSLVGPTVTNEPNSTPTLTPFEASRDLPGAQLSSTTISPEFSPSLTPLSAHIPALPYYSLEAVLDYTAHSLSVDEIILYQNETGSSLSDLVLAVEPNIWKNCFSLAGLMVNGLLINDLHPDGGGLMVPLPAPLPSGEGLNIILHYDLALPPADIYHVFGYNAEQVNLVDWYPFIVPYSNGWLLHPPANVGEHLVYPESTFDVTFRSKDGSDPLILAASAPAEVGAGSLHYHLSAARTFAISASPLYQTVTKTVNNIPVTSYYFEPEKNQSLEVLDEVAKALATYSTLFGLFPYPSLNIVESPFFDGMEYDGLFLLSRNYYDSSDGTALNNLVDIAVHETAHQWWFGAVGSDQALEPWLDEALSTYSERLFYEANYPGITGWQKFRVDDFSPSGWVDTSIYQGRGFRLFANAVYLRGAQFLQVLRLRIGDEVFFTFLKDYAGQMTGRLSTTSDFFRILRDHTNQDISDIIAEFFRNPYYVQQEEK
jgi:hypothetical protein